jgi:K+-transporting ATPase ATPase A chain
LIPPNGLLQLAVYVAVLLALAKPLGDYMARVFEHRASSAQRILGPLERLIYRMGGIDPAEEMGWQTYAATMLIFNAAGVLFLYLLQRVQGLLPLNPAGLAAVAPDLSFNTAISFASSTSWQAYAGETTLSHLSQMVGIATQSFLSAATGMAILAAVIRGLARQGAASIGNFWADMVRSTLYILLPLSLVLALALASDGVIQTLAPSATVSMLQSSREQAIAVGPVASQVAIKQLSAGDGGGFFNASSAHPLENPTPLSNFLEMLAILIIPASLCSTFGVMVGDQRQGWAILIAMTLIFVALLAVCVVAEQAGNPLLARMGVDQIAGDASAGGNMEGKEARFGVVNSALWAAVTAASADGSVNAMLDSFTPLGGFVPLVLIQFGEVVYGGAGSGLYSMVTFIVIAVFIAGLMIGRMPEYLGKKIEAYEMKMASLAILIPPVVALTGTAIATATAAGRVGVSNPGAHGFTQLLYAFSSAANNNGSAFSGLNANTPFYNVALGLAMLIGRYWVAIPVLALAGSLAAKPRRGEPGLGTLPTHTPLFVGLVVGVVTLVGVLTFIPALALGPIVEHLQLTGLESG